MEDSLSKKQFGFKKGTSTETALHKVIHKIEKRIAKEGYVLGTFLDIEGAFDNVSFKAISEAIDESPLDSSTAGWIKNMVTITHKNATRRIKTKRGCPQGGVLSPFLWNLVIDDLLQYTAKHIPGYIQAFADDIMSLAEGDDLDVIWQRTQTTIKTIENWCQSKGLNISALKTKIVMFTAIKHAAEELITFKNKQITFWSDSLSALQALSNKTHNNKSITDCHKALTKLADENTVKLNWIKAHTGHWGNEKADELAKAGTVSSNLVCSLVPLNHIKNMINDKVNNLTQTRWNSNRHAHTDLILGNHHKKTLRILTNNLNNRTRYRTGICIITGHIGLNKHLHRINRSDTPNCPNCIDTEETVAHYIGQCPPYSRMRGDTLGTYYDSINDIMDNNNIDLIINFALKTKRLLKKEDKDDTGVT